MASKLHFLIVDDHSIVRTGLKILLRDMFMESVFDEAHDGDTAIALVKKQDYDLVVADIHMPNTDSSNLISNILAIKPGTRILIFSMASAAVFARRYLNMGVMGFVNKDSSDAELQKAVNMILQNRKYLPPEFSEEKGEDATEGAAAENPFTNLSAREFELALHLVKGKTPSEIMAALNIQSSTISTHKARIFEKLKVSNLIELKELAQLYHVYNAV